MAAESPERFSRASEVASTNSSTARRIVVASGGFGVEHSRHWQIAAKQFENRDFFRRGGLVAIVQTQHNLRAIVQADTAVAVHETARQQLDIAHTPTRQPGRQHPLDVPNGRRRHVAGPPPSEFLVADRA